MGRTLKTLNPTEKVAILLISLGEELATELLRGLPVADVQRIVDVTARLGQVDADLVIQVQNEFQAALSSQKKSVVGNHAAASKLIKIAFSGNPPESLKNMGPVTPQAFLDAEHADPALIHRILSRELPQTVAVILAHLSAKKAGDVLSKFNTVQKSDILLRMASMDEIDQEVLHDMAEQFGSQLEKARRQNMTHIGGVDRTAAILAAMNGSQRDELLKNISANKPELAEAIRSELWTFEDLAKLDTADIEKLLRSVAAVDLETALRGASDTLKARIFKAMSTRRVEQLKENLLAAKPVAVAKVEEAQRRIAGLAADLIAKGDLRDPAEEAV